MICLITYITAMFATALILRKKNFGFQVLSEGAVLSASMIVLSTLLYHNPFEKPRSFPITLIFMAIPLLWSEGEIDIPMNLSFAIAATTLLPASEEILFRWCLLKEFGLFVSSAIFSLIHLTNVFSKIEKFSIETLIVRFLLGAILGEIALQSGSIIPSIVIHSAINLFAVYKSKL